MPRREPDGDTGVEVAIDRIRDIERELEELKAFVAGKLPHDHDSRYDGRYVHESGDTMTGTLNFQDGDGQLHPVKGTGTSDVRRLELQSEDADTVVRLFQDRGTNSGSKTSGLEVRIDSDGTGHATAFTVDGDGNVVVQNDFTVNGSKNAQIDPEDPDNPNLRYRFAAVEADEPGLLFHRLTVTVPTGGAEATVDLPPHWSRIARDGDAMVTPLDDTRDQAPAAAAVDLTVPEVTVRGKPGDYRVWVAAARADAGVDGWTHEVEVTPDDEDV